MCMRLDTKASRSAKCSLTWTLVVVSLSMSSSACQMSAKDTEEDANATASLPGVVVVRDASATYCDKSFIMCTPLEMLHLEMSACTRERHMRSSNA